MGVPFAISKSFSGMAYSPAVPVSELSLPPSEPPLPLSFESPLPPLPPVEPPLPFESPLPPVEPPLPSLEPPLPPVEPPLPLPVESPLPPVEPPLLLPPVEPTTVHTVSRARTKLPRICVAPVRSAVIGIRIGIRLGISRSLLRHRLVHAVRSRGNHLRSVLHGHNISAFAIKEFLSSVNRLGKRVTCRLVRDLACRTVKQRLCVSNGLLQCGSRLIHFQSSLAGVHSCGCCGNGLWSVL